MNSEKYYINHQQRVWLVPLVFFLLFRVVLSGISYYTLRDISNNSRLSGLINSQQEIFPVPDDNFFQSVFLNGWYRADTIAYIYIASEGYADTNSSTAYAPLYPLLMRLTAPLFGNNYMLTSLAVSNIFCYLSLVMIYKLILEEYEDDQLGLNVLWAIIIFPTGIYLFSAYAESIFLFFVICTWFCVRRGKWSIAGICAGLATLARFQGITLLFLLGSYWLLGEDLNLRGFRLGNPINLFRRMNLDRWPIKSVSMLMPLLVLGSFILWREFSGMRTMIETYHTDWNNPLVAPWKMIPLIVRRLFLGNLGIVDFLNITLFVSSIVLIVIGVKYLHPVLLIYSVVTVFLTAWISTGSLAVAPDTGAILTSYSRYMITTFPLFIVLAAQFQRKSRLLLFSLISLPVEIVVAWMILNYWWVA